MRVRPIRTAVLLLAVVLAAMSMLAARRGSAAPAARPDRPNIIFILTDDLDAKSVAFMPRLKSLLADRGVTFTSFFVTTALCCPSRSSILRGQYVHNHQVLNNQAPTGGYQKFHSLGHESSTVGTWLKAAGYLTALFGKYLNGYPGRTNPTFVPPGWDEWGSPAGGNPYANFNYQLNENGRLVSYGRRPDDYMTDVLSRKAVEFIRRSGQAGQPFFVYLATYAPHAPATPAPRHESMFPNETAPRAPSFNEQDVSDKPAWVRNRDSLLPRATSGIDEHYRVRLRSLQAVDEMIGALVDALQAAGELQRTYIFFTSDNGWHLGEHRIAAGKNTPYEESIHVPLIVRGPGVPEGRTMQHLVINEDFAPTFAQIAGASIPDFVDGRSMLPLLGAAPPESEQWRRAFTVEHFREVEDGLPQARVERQAPSRVIPEYHAVRTKDLVYIEYVTGERELYDLARDPYEMQSLHASADQGFLRQMAAYLAALRRCAGPGCRAAEDSQVPVLTAR